VWNIRFESGVDLNFCDAYFTVGRCIESNTSPNGSLLLSLMLHFCPFPFAGLDSAQAALRLDAHFVAILRTVVSHYFRL
jgi:hypothetical protein